jgi:Flp pilus assembly pilin Flp
MTQPARQHQAPRAHRATRAHRERGAAAVEYGLLAAGVVGAFLIGAIGLQAVSGAVLDQTVTSIEEDGTVPPATP